MLCVQARQPVAKDETVFIHDTSTVSAKLGRDNHMIRDIRLSSGKSDRDNHVIREK